MSKEPKRCACCEGRGLHVWTDRAGIVHGVTCEDCKGTGKDRPILKPTPETHD